MHLQRQYSAVQLDEMLAGILGDSPRETLARIDRDDVWDRVIDHAWRTQCGGMLAERMSSLDHVIPSAAARQLTAYCEHVSANNAYKANRVAPIFAALNDAKIPFLVLKGLALSTVLYDSPAIRPMTDIDVLIRPEDVAKADEVLVAICGCRRGEELVQDDFYPSFHYEREYITPHTPGVKIDLHARPFRPLRYARTMPDDAMWDGGEILARVQGVPFMLPSRENMLIHLCVHAACHGLRSLRWMYDIKRWIEKHADTLNWNTVVTRCEAWGLSHALRVALAHTASVFGMDSRQIADVAVVLRCNEKKVDQLVLWQAPYGQARPFTDVIVNAICSPGLGFRAAYLRAAMIPSRDHLGQIYPHRHWGWPAAAHAFRVLRCLTRPFQHNEDIAA